MHPGLGPSPTAASSATPFGTSSGASSGTSPRASRAGPPAGLQPLSARQVLALPVVDVVFAGGGNRCWWQAGLVERLRHHPNWQPLRYTGASAGAGIATATALGTVQQALRAAVDRFNATPRNVEWAHLLKGQRPFALPRIYPDWLHSFFQPADWARLKAQTLQVDVAITRPIRGLPLTVSSLLALTLYATEKFWLRRFHARVPHRLGFRTEHWNLAHSASLADAHNLLGASAACVPITPVARVGGRPALDGGFYDALPRTPLPEHLAPPNGQTLVLMTRHRPDLPTHFALDGRLYWQPTRRTAASSFNCTSGQAVQDTFDHGLSDGDRALLGA